MKKRFFLFVLGVFFSSFSTFALRISTSEAGELSKLVSDKNVTELIVSGLIDVRDIKFIAEEMPALKSLDLSHVHISAYSSNVPYFSDALEYEENVLPAYCFFDKDYETVKLPSSLEVVGESAFAGCDMLSDVTLPAGLISIGNYAFSSCSVLKNMTVPQSIKNIGKGTFSHCSSLVVVDLSMLDEGCVTGENMFAHCTALEKVVLSNKIVNIPNGAFAGCLSLSSVEMRENMKLESIGERAFESTALSSFALESCTNIKYIGGWAFGNTQLQEMCIPANVETLGEGAFFYNNQLEYIVMPQNLSELSAFVLSGATSLKNIKLGVGTKMIGKYAFEDNTAMTEMIVNAISVPELGENVFDRMNQSSVALKVPIESVELYKSAEQWKEFNVIGGNIGIEDSENWDGSIKIYFAEDNLCVTASENIQFIRVYEPGGIMIVSCNPCAEYATVKLEKESKTVYIVAVQLESGIYKTIKLVK